MKKFKITEIKTKDGILYVIFVKKNWFSRWKFIRRKDNEIMYFEKERYAKSYLNLLTRKK